MDNFGIYSIATERTQVKKPGTTEWAYDVRMCLYTLLSIALQRDGSKDMTGNLNLAGNSLLSVATGNFLDLISTGQASLNNVSIAGNLELYGAFLGPDQVAGFHPTIMRGTTTSSGTGTINATGLDFSWLPAYTSVALIPDDYASGAFPVLGVASATSIDLAENTATGKTTKAISSGVDFQIINVVDDKFIRIGEINFTAGETGGKSISINGSEEGVKRRLIMVNVVNTDVADSYVMSYGGTTYTSFESGGAGGKSYFAASGGDNNLTITKTGTNGAGLFHIYAEEMLEVGVAN